MTRRALLHLLRIQKPHAQEGNNGRHGEMSLDAVANGRRTLMLLQRRKLDAGKIDRR
jgi:hypothetical protein